MKLILRPLEYISYCETTGFQKYKNLPLSSHVQQLPKGHNSDVVTHSFILSASLQENEGGVVNKNRLVCSTNVCSF